MLLSTTKLADSTANKLILSQNGKRALLQHQLLNDLMAFNELPERFHVIEILFNLVLSSFPRTFETLNIMTSPHNHREAVPLMHEASKVAGGFHALTFS